MKLFLKEIARAFTGNLHTNRTKFPENSKAIFLRNDFIYNVQLYIFRFVHTNTFCEYRKKLHASPREHLVISAIRLFYDYYNDRIGILRADQDDVIHSADRST